MDHAVQVFPWGKGLRQKTSSRKHRDIPSVSRPTAVFSRTFYLCLLLMDLTDLPQSLKSVFETCSIKESYMFICWYKYLMKQFYQMKHSTCYLMLKLSSLCKCTLSTQNTCNNKKILLCSFFSSRFKKTKTFANERFRGGRPVENVLFVVHFLLFIAQK